MADRLKGGKLTDCGQKALRQSKVVVTQDPLSSCTDCPLARMYSGGGAIAIRLEHGGKIYGLLSASISIDFLSDEEEQSLLQEVAADIAFALHSIELEKKRKRAEEALRESEEKLRSIIEHSTNVFYSHTPEHVITYMSPQVKEILGYEVSEVMIRWTELASDNPINKKGFELTVKAIETGKPQSPYELELVHKSGEKVWIEVHEGPVVVDGKTISIVGAFTDITKRKQAEEELAKHHDHLEETVQERTAELQKMVNLMAGREVRMAELKEVIQKLRTQVESAGMTPVADDPLKKI
jgi:PAS domain S-box-containing protein